MQELFTRPDKMNLWTFSRHQRLAFDYLNIQKKKKCIIREVEAPRSLLPFFIVVCYVEGFDLSPCGCRCVILALS
jgi:hypothetical protein